MEPWILPAIPGTQQAKLVQKKNWEELLGTKKKILIIGAHIDYNMIKFIKELSTNYGIKIIGIGKGYKVLKENGVPADFCSDIAEAKTKHGNVDTIFLAGFSYYFASNIFSHFKHFSKITTVSIERFYQPNATYSFPNLTPKRWEQFIQDLK
jgi:acetyl-CoA decarbonylase/synthase complex subunit epsilon